MKKKNIVLAFLSFVLCLIITACGGGSSDHEGKYINKMMNSSITLKSGGQFDWDLIMVLTGKYSISGTKITFQITGDKEKLKGTLEDDVIDLQGLKYTRERTYTVSFNTDGGTPIITQAIKKGEKAVKPNAPTKDGYYFENWYVDSKKTQIYDFNEEVTRNLTLYASWSYYCQITFDKGEGSGGTASVNATYGESMPYAIAPTSNREDYLFAGYYDAKYGGNKYYNPDMSSARNWNKNEWSILYAGWVIEGATFTVTLDHQGGYSSVYSVEAKFGEDMPAIAAPTRLGYKFLGYYDSISGGTKYYNADMSSARKWDIADDVTLYARWEISQSSISFDKQGGSGGTYSVTATYGEPMPNATAPTREGYTFNGYYDAVSEGTKYYNADMSSARTWDKTDNAILYARWIGETYTVTFDNQGGSGGTASVNATYGSPMPSATAPTSTKEGYSFYGYYDAVSGGTKYYNADMSSARNWDKANNATLYARWTGDAYTVILDKQGGSGGTSSVIATYGQPMPNATAPTREGYSFYGYYDAINDGTKYYNADMSSAKNWDKASNATLYARWIGESYTVTFDKQGGSGGTASVNATYGSPMPSATAPTSTKEGYSFYGYYDAVNGGTKYYNADMSSARNWDKTSNATLYARWTVNTYTITLDMQGGSGGTASVNATYGEPMPNATAPAPTRIGNTFNGYYDAVSGGTKYYNADMSSARNWNKANNTILYARWIFDENYAGTEGLEYSCDASTCSVTGYGYTGVSNTVDIPVWHDGKKVTSIGSYAFYWRNSLTSITIPSNVTIIGERAFYNCSSLKTVTFETNSNLKSIGFAAFYGCGSLTSITIPSGVTIIGECAFSECRSLTSITIPSGVTSIGSSAFSFCSSLKTVTFEDNSNLTSIGDYAFASCSSLTSITIPSSVTSIGFGVFYDWTSSQTIYIQGRASAPATWSSDWNAGCSANIVWNA